MVETASNADEKRCSDGTSNGNELNLPICKMALKLVNVVRHEAFANVIASACCRLLFVVAVEDTHRGEFLRAFCLMRKILKEEKGSQAWEESNITAAQTSYPQR